MSESQFKQARIKVNIVEKLNFYPFITNYIY